MSSAFNLLTAGGANFDKKRFKADHDLFAKHTAKSDNSKGKQKAASRSMKDKAALPSSLNIFHDPSSSASHGKNGSSSKHGNSAAAGSQAEQSDEEDDESDADEEDEEEEDAEPQPPKQKITLTGPSPLPTSLHANLPSLLHHPSHMLPASSGQPLLRALELAGIRSLWGVQCAVSGSLLEGKDTIVVAPTGSGKTLSYVLPTLVSLQDPTRVRAAAKQARGEGEGIRAVVIVPTHDLAVQIHQVVEAVTEGRKWRTMVLSKSTERAVCESASGANGPEAPEKEKADGDESMDGASGSESEEDGESDEEEEEAVLASKASLGIDILIATPERLHHLLSSKRISLKHTKHLVMDESDRLLGPDFVTQVSPIVKACKGAQKCLLSATMPAGAEEIARTCLADPVRIVVGLKDSAVSTVSQSLLYTANESGKLLALRQLIAQGSLPYPSLIFVQSIERADDLHKQLVLDVEGLRVGVVHGGKSNAARDETVAAFREGRVWVLVVTEVMARGMDFGGVKVVVNYDFPQTTQSYIHRIGRTGRAGRHGKAITFFSKEDAPHLRSIANILHQANCDVPQWMLDLPKVSKNLKRHRAQAPVKRKKVGGGGRDLALEERKKKGQMVRGSKRRKEGQGQGEGKRVAEGP